MTELRLDIYAPVTEVKFGSFTVDPVAAVLGMSLPEKMTPFLCAPHRRLTEGGAARYLFPCAVDDGAEIALDLGPLGTFAAANDGGLLKLTLPAVILRDVTEALQDDIESAQRQAGGGILWVRLRAGARVSLPLGGFGSLDFVVPA